MKNILNMSCVLSSIAGVVTGMCLLALGSNPAAARPLERLELSESLGGCPNTGCESQSCNTNGSCIKQGLFYFACSKFRNSSGTDKCLKLISNPFARCGDPGSKTGFSCSETSGGGCVSQKLGDLNGEGECTATSCTVASGTCGNTKYTCTATGCE